MNTQYELTNFTKEINGITFHQLGTLCDYEVKGKKNDKHELHGWATSLEDISNNVIIGKDTFIYPGVTICENTIINSGCTIDRGVMISTNVHIEANVEIGRGTTIEADVLIGNDVSIGCGATIGWGICINDRITISNGEIVTKI